MKKFITAIALAASCFTFSNCGGGGGGGGGGSDDAPPTVRPKTLNGIVLVLDTNVRFEFVRNIGSAPALTSGDVETGVFFYQRNGKQLRTYPNTNSDNSDLRYPDSITSASYSYRAINTTSGIITLTGFGVNDLINDGGGIFGANNGSFVYLFNRDSTGATNSTVVIDVTFSGSGPAITSNTVTVTQPGGNPLFDSVRIPSAVLLATGGSVPTNYNPTVDPNRPSRIAPVSLNNKLFRFTNGIPDPTANFSVQFVSDTVPVPNSNNDEIGTGLLRVAGTAVDNAVNYTYTRTPGTDDAILVISSANNTFDGRYTLRFAGTDNGTYIGEVDAGTPDAAQVSGTFFVVPNSTTVP